LSFVLSAEVAKLSVFLENDGLLPIHETSDNQEIAEILKTIDVRFEQWAAQYVLSENATSEEVVAAYQRNIDQLTAENGYQTVDVIRILPDNPKKVELRNKFLNEHSHTENEVRFFVEGSAAFYLHTHGHVYMVRAEAGDLMSIPANYNHWFDMGAEPKFTAIRFFINADGWVAHFTESEISDNFPMFGEED
jgi:1,2-dihydroxy-3-keto-5-methylthiopentene dioxygenase